MKEGGPRSAGWDALGFLPVRILRASLRNLPPEKAVRFGASCGRAIARVGGGGVRVARTNLALAFPEKSEVEREDLIRDIYANMGRVVAELALLQGPHRRALLAGVRIEGLEHLAGVGEACVALLRERLGEERLELRRNDQVRGRCSSLLRAPARREAAPPVPALTNAPPALCRC